MPLGQRLSRAELNSPLSIQTGTKHSKSNFLILSIKLALLLPKQGQFF